MELANLRGLYGLVERVVMWYHVCMCEICMYVSYGDVLDFWNIWWVGKGHMLLINYPFVGLVKSSWVGFVYVYMYVHIIMFTYLPSLHTNTTTIHTCWMFLCFVLHSILQLLYTINSVYIYSNYIYMWICDMSKRHWTLCVYHPYTLHYVHVSMLFSTT